MKVWRHTRPSDGVKMQPGAGVHAFYKGQTVPVDRLSFTAAALEELRRRTLEPARKRPRG